LALKLFKLLAHVYSMTQVINYCQI
jgi:hypothetical protein